jgi:hypothetical protein
MREHPRKDLVDQEMFESRRRQSLLRATGDRASASIDEKRRELGHAEPVGVAVTRAGQDNLTLGRSPVVVPSVGRRRGPFGQVEADGTLCQARPRRRKLGERYIAFEDEIGETVEHATKALASVRVRTPGRFQSLRS